MAAKKKAVKEQPKAPEGPKPPAADTKPKDPPAPPPPAAPEADRPLSAVITTDNAPNKVIQPPPKPKDPEAVTVPKGFDPAGMITTANIERFQAARDAGN